jgi:hypothetical protein
LHFHVDLRLSEDSPATTADRTTAALCSHSQRIASFGTRTTRVSE